MSKLKKYASALTAILVASACVLFVLVMIDDPETRFRFEKFFANNHARNGAKESASPPPSNPQPIFAASYFLDILDREGSKGIVDRLYIAPPDLMKPLIDGISTGLPEWLKVYDRFRKGLDSVDRSGITMGSLDDALARALEKAPENILLYLREHSDISPKSICERAAASYDDDADVLDAREFLAIVRREHSVSKVNNARLQAERSACLKAMSDLIRRQSRIYLASHGAADSASRSFANLSESEQLELRPVIDLARRDVTISAREDGTLPDGPFRLATIPRDVLRNCVDQDGRIANPEGPWQATDVGSDPPLPQARLLNSCKVASDEWDLSCEVGGFGRHLLHFRMRQTQDKWIPVEEKGRFDAKASDSWVDCHTLSRLVSPQEISRP